MPEIHWYPGHMAKFRRILIDQLKSVDAVIELCDARAPAATRNPDLDRLCANKARILVMNKADLADDQMTRRWIDYYSKQGLTACKFVAAGGKLLDRFRRGGDTGLARPRFGWNADSHRVIPS